MYACVACLVHRSPIRSSAKEQQGGICGGVSMCYLKVFDMCIDRHPGFLSISGWVSNSTTRPVIAATKGV